MDAKPPKQSSDVKDLYYIPPDPNEDAVNYWLWFNRVIVWPAAPKTFQKFGGRVESYKPLRLWAEEPAFKGRWLHALLYHLTEMWSADYGRLRPAPLRTGRRGRPAVQPNVEWDLCVLDLIMHGLLGPKDAAGRTSRHWVETVKLLKHLFKDEFPETWDRRNLKPRVNAYLREHRAGEEVYEKFLDVLQRSSWFVSDEYRQKIQGHLSRDVASPTTPDKRLSPT